MGWSTEDGKHEMWVAARFADGAVSGGSNGAGYQVMYAADGTDVYAHPAGSRYHREIELTPSTSRTPHPAPGPAGAGLDLRCPTASPAKR